MMVSKRQVGISGRGKEGQGSSVGGEKLQHNALRLERHRNSPGGKRPQERWQNKERGLAQYHPWLSVAVTWL